MPANHPTQDLIETLLPNGPVLILADGAVDGIDGLPDDFRDKVLVFDLAGPLARQALDRADGAHLPLRYGLPDGEDDTATLPWDCIFSVAGRETPERVATKTRVDLIPDWLGEDRRTTMRWLMRHLGLGDLPPDPTDWRLKITPDMMVADRLPEGFEPEPRRALERIFEMQPPVAALLLDTTCPGLVLPAAWPRLDGGAAQVPVTPLPPVQGLQIDDDGVLWRAPIADGDKQMGIQPFYVPWKAIGALQHPSQAMGWFWPLRLPERMRTPMQANAELAPHLERLHGAPLAGPQEPPDHAPPLAVLSPPNQIGRSEALQDCGARGGGMLLLDARLPGVELSPGLTGAGLLAVPFGVPGIETSIEFDGVALEASLPGFDGEPAAVKAPWQAVFVIGANQGALRVHCWPDDYPDDITLAMSLLRHMAANDGELDPAAMEGLPVHLGDGPPDLMGQGVAVGLGRDEAGQYVLQLVQRCGRTNDEGQTPELRVQFCLRMKAMH